jgi:copper chaperone CopZ
MQAKTVTIPNIGCDGCVRTIISELSAQPGVISVSGDKDAKAITVQWDAPASWESIQAKLVEIDYPPLS